MSDLILKAIINGACSGLFGAGGVYAMIRLREYLKDKSDKKRVLNWLVENETSNTALVWRSSKAIAAHTNLPIDRVTYICSIHPEIKMSTGSNEDMWQTKHARKV